MIQQVFATFRRLIIRSLLGAAIVTGIVGCGENVVAPTAARTIRPATPNRDDPPPDSPCLTGWIQIDGRWVCGDGSGNI